jgi:signal transduction histidine kinase
MIAYVPSAQGGYGHLHKVAVPQRAPYGRDTAALQRGDVLIADGPDEAERHLLFLTKVARELAAPWDEEQICDQIVRLALPDLAEWCVLHTVDAGCALRAVSAAHRDQEQDPRAFGLWQRALRSTRGLVTSLKRVAQSGEPHLLVATDDTSLVPDGVCWTLQPRLLASLGLSVALCVPLRAADQTLGVLMLGATTAGRYGRIELALAEAFAQQAASAMDRARQSTRAREARERERLVLAGVIHDLAGPVTAIMLRTNLLQRRLGSAHTTDDVQIREGLGHIVAATLRMSTMVEDLRGLLRAQSGAAAALQLHSVDLVALVHQVVADHQLLTDRHHIRVVTRPPDARLFGLWDGLHLERAISNLVSNAIKYSPDGGEIVIEVGEEHLAKGPAGGEVVVRVRDHGMGIPADDLARIFEPFHRGRNVAGRVAGMGLGLANVRQIVTQHGGTVHVASKPGQGTTFTVRLPLRRDGRDERDDWGDRLLETDVS